MLRFETVRDGAIQHMTGKRDGSSKSLDVQLHMRLTSSDRDRLAKLGGVIPMPMNAIAREAMRLGMSQLEKNPSALIQPVSTR
jgi:hypothetical protein